MRSVPPRPHVLGIDDGPFEKQPGAVAPLVGVLMEGPDLVEAVALTRSPVDGEGVTEFLAAWIESLRFRPASAAHPLTPLLVAGAALALVLVLVDRGAVLAWSFGLLADAGRVPLAGVGTLFGGALVLTLAGTLLLLALRVSGAGAPVVTPARAALWLAVVLAAAGSGLAALRLALLPMPMPVTTTLLKPAGFFTAML